MAAFMKRFPKLSVNHLRVTLSAVLKLTGQFNIFVGKRFTTPQNFVRQSVFQESVPTVKIGTAVFGTSWAFLGLWKTKEEEELSEHDQVRQLVSKGIVSRENRDVQKASKAFHEALNLSSDFLQEQRIDKTEHLNHRVFIYVQIANLSMDIGDLKNAEAVFKDTMKLALQLGMAENDNAMIEMSMKLAMIYLYSGREKLAIVGLQHCIAEQEKKLNDNGKEETSKESKDKDLDKLQEEEINTKVLLGKAYQNYANVFLQRRDFKGAQPLLVKSLDISKNTLGCEHDTTFVVMNDLATCQIMMKEYETAETTLKDGICSSSKVGSLMEAALCSNLGALYIRTNRLSEALAVCDKGLKVAEKGNDIYLQGPCKACLSKVKELRSANKN